MVASLPRPRSRLPFAAGLLASVCTLWASPAAATELEDFNNARTAYDQHNFARAVALFEQMVGARQPAISSAVLVQESRKYLAASYVFVGNESGAEQQFEWLLRESPSYALNPSLFPRPVVDIFERVRGRLNHERSQQAEQRRQEEARRARERNEAQRALLAIAEWDEVVIQHEPALAWVPFGVGQLQNGNEMLGLTLLVTESLTLGAAGILMTTWFPLYEADPNFFTVSESTLLGLQIGYSVAFGAFGALAIVGIIEAVASYVPSHTVRRRRRIPRDILERLDLAIGVGTIELRGRF